MFIELPRALDVFVQSTAPGWLDDEDSCTLTADDRRGLTTGAGGRCKLRVALPRWSGSARTSVEADRSPELIYTSAPAAQGG